MRNDHLFCAVLCATVALTGTAWGATLHVPGEYGTIQAAIDAASDGDTVLIADGTYTGPGNRDIDFGGLSITVRSERGAAYTIIDCQGQGRGFVFQSQETRDARIQGLTIRNGYAEMGGAILCLWSSPIIENCILEDNTAYDTWENGLGGAVYCYGYGPTVMAEPLIRGCLIRGNSAERQTETGSGGGLACLPWSEVTVHNCTIYGNQAEASGGGILVTGDSLTTVRNSILWDNTASLGPEGAVYNGTLNVDFSDVRDGDSDEEPDIYVPSGDLQWGDNNILEDPLFIDPPDNLRICAKSPAFERGDNSVIIDTDFTEDLDGRPRIIDGDGDETAIVDMGAYEACGDDSHCSDFDACTCNECGYGVCTFTPRAYGDVDCDGTVSVFDVFAIQAAIAGGYYDENLDIHPCAGNGVLSVLDMLAVLDAIAGIDPCCGG